jgi:HK97 family phage major capsid protein
MENQEISLKLDEAMLALKASREANEMHQKKYDALNLATQEKADKVVLDTMEMKQRMEQLEAALARGNQRIEQSGLNTKEVDESREAFKSFMRGDEKAIKELSAKSMNRGTNPDGGYLVSPTVEAMITARIFETSPVRTIADVTTISQSDSLKFVLDDGEDTSGGWVGEQSTRAETQNSQLREKLITVHEQYSEPKSSQQLLEDAAVDIEAWLAGKISSKFSRVENAAFVAGNGSAKPTGFLNYAAWTTAGTYEAGKIEQVNSGSAGTFTADGLIDLQGSLLEPYQAGAAFIFRRQSFTQIMKLKSGDGEYLFNKNLDRRAGIAFDLLGAPVYFASDMPAIASNALAGAYGNFKMGYKVVDRTGISILRDPFTIKGQVLFYARKRTGGDVINFEAIKIQKLAA